MRIAVILSAYNGEKYIKQQIDSILAQIDVDLDLFVRDDGSKDSTVSILREFEKCNNNVHIREGKNIGFRQSFIQELIAHDGFDYYAFSDQDDYWEPYKLFRAISMMNSFSTKSVPSVYYSNLKIANEGLEVYRKTQLEKRKHTLGSVTMRRSIAGCTMVINKSMWKQLADNIITDSMLRRGHDSFIISLCYSIKGNVICDSNAYICYRQHSDNTSGGMDGFRQRLIKEWNILTQKKGQESDIASAILATWDKQIGDCERLILGRVARNRVKDRIAIVLSPEYSTGDVRLSIASKIRVILGML